MSLRYDRDKSPSPTSCPYSTNCLPLTGDMNSLNYTVLESAVSIDPSLTSFHLNDSNNNISCSSGFHVDSLTYLQSPQKRR